ncbi:uncharacterized protein LOC143037715 [Oratosquilla oratoria]|uniref:uncharacterized protein LOC143037715 n=1 Tax=Oratosquilla oratoria TaxID=337810 RepID=UPI003F7654FC
MRLKILRLILLITASTVAFVLLNFTSHRPVLNGVFQLAVKKSSGEVSRSGRSREGHVVNWRKGISNGSEKKNQVSFHTKTKAFPSPVLFKRLGVLEKPRAVKIFKTESDADKGDRRGERPADTKEKTTTGRHEPQNGYLEEDVEEFRGDRDVGSPPQIEEVKEEKPPRFEEEKEEEKEEETPLGGQIDEWWLHDREVEFSRRREVVESVCGKISEVEEPSEIDAKKHMTMSDLVTEPPKLEHFLLAKSMSSMTCPINKAASTSLILALLKAENPNLESRLDKHTSPHSVATAFRPKVNLKFDVGREGHCHGMKVKEAVVKAQDNSLLAFRIDISECMKQLRQEDITNALLSSPRTETLEQREYRLALVRENQRNRENAIRKGRPYDRDAVSIPSFNDFLRYVLYCDTHSSFSSHWMPYWFWCSPCQINYSIIAKLETAADDFKYLWYRLGLLTKQQVPWQNSSADKEESSRLKNLAKYYSTLDPDVIHAVYQKYELDFELFEYDIREVLRIGGHCSWRGETLC